MRAANPAPTYQMAAARVRLNGVDESPTEQAAVLVGVLGATLTITAPHRGDAGRRSSVCVDHQVAVGSATTATPLP